MDGLVEHQIYNKLHEMGVAITTYKIRSSTEKEVAIMIAAGFTGMLKHWWNNYCKDETKHLIYNTTAIENIVKTEGTAEITSQVTREDDRNDGRIPYSQLTYGDLVSTINIIGLELCTDIKLKHQLKKEQSSSRRELGSFCQDFGFITPPDRVKKDKKPHRSSFQRRDSTKPRKKKSRSKRPRDSKQDVCWTCSKTGHKSSECRSNTKKKKISLLGIDEDTQDKLLSILDKPFSNSSYSSGEYSDDEDIQITANPAEIAIALKLFVPATVLHKKSESSLMTLKKPSSISSNTSMMKKPINIFFLNLNILFSTLTSLNPDNEDESINNDHLAEPFFTKTGNNPSTSDAPGVIVVSSVRPQSHLIPWCRS
ncbi:hypothetical protein KY285_023569 [Solanum tuberosum]|nr:hypothetical protein KY285_023569 [Solanum tuberosum]